MLNVFTRSRHAPYSDAAFVHENDELSYVSAMRLREDELFVRRMTQTLPKGLKANLHMVDLNLKDAPIRLRCAQDALSDLPVNPADPAIEKIRAALARQSQLGANEALVLPAALGRHVDHATVREAAHPFVSSLPCAFYEDLPYAATHPSAAADLDSLQASFPGERLAPVLCSSAEPVERKRALILGYASQIDAESADIITALAAHYGNGERLWANGFWCAVAAAGRLSVPG